MGFRRNGIAVLMSYSRRRVKRPLRQANRYSSAIQFSTQGATMSQAKYKHVEQDGVSFDLPEGLEIRGQAPSFLAMSRDRTCSFYLEVNAHEVVWDATLRLIHRPLPANDKAMVLEVVRRGKVDTPYPGDELVFQTTITETGLLTWKWVLALNADGVRIDCQASGLGAFEKSEPIWRRTIESLHVAPKR
jgi:hypothetical protein